MQATTLPTYAEDLPPGHISPAHYFAIAQQAIAVLRWRRVAVTGNSITCHTAADRSFGESVSITVTRDKISFISTAANEYYWVDGQNARNADLFKRVVARLADKQLKAQRNLSPVKREKYGAFVPSATYMVTPVLLYLNVLVYLAMVAAGIAPLEPETKDLLAWGGNFRPAVVDGGWWRLITCMFLHAGIMHLLMNMYALLYIGMYLEPLLGRLRLAAAYMLTGICAGLLSITMHSYSVGVGASGAIFGLYGIFLAMLTTNHLEKTMRKTMLRSILFFVVFNLFTGMQGNTDNAAHIGGLLGGLAMGYALQPGITRHHTTGRQALLIAAAAVCVLLFAAFTIARLAA